MLKVHSMFTSISGEVGGCPQGSLAFFIRLAGCNLSCSYCDAPEARAGIGQDIKLYAIMEAFAQSGCKNVVITGGEPLLQEEDLEPVCAHFIKSGINVTIETNGTLPVPLWSWGGRRPVWVIDYKLPGSVHNTEDVPFFAYQQNITKNDWLKFVIFDQCDYVFALEKVFHCKEGKDREWQEIQIAFSPGFDKNGKDTLPIWKQWFLNSALLRRHRATLNYQIHKILGLE